MLRVFLRLGLTSFGGPVAHLGYFRAEFVERRRWLDEPAFADIVALCQFLPGPASSQVGISLGILRAGLPGAFAAWLDAHHPRSKDEWVRLFKKTFVFTGGEITSSFLMSCGYLPGAHDEMCPVFGRIAKLGPAWMRSPSA